MKGNKFNSYNMKVKQVQLDEYQQISSVYTSNSDSSSTRHCRPHWKSSINNDNIRE